MKRIAIIGGGPVGCYAGELLAGAGHDVHIFEEHREIGKPVQCTGIISKNLRKIVPVESFVVNKVKGAVFYSRRRKFELATGRMQAYIVDRKRMDTFFARRARKAGAKIYLNHKFRSFSRQKNGKIKLRFWGNKTDRGPNPALYDLLIGADGPVSPVAKSAGLYRKRDFLVGVQAVVKGKFDPDNVQVFLGSICPDFFAWLVPESASRARLGLASRKNAGARFQRFLSMFPELEVKERQGGLIPLFKERGLQRNNIYLVGDAGMHVKATTGGGVMTGLLAAEALARSIIRNKPYAHQLKKLNRELKITGMIRKSLNKFNDMRYDQLLDIANKQGIRKILETHGDMDFPTRFIFRILFKEPRLLRFLL